MNMLSKAQGNAVDTHVQSEETPGKKGKVNKNDIIDGKAITFDSNGKVMLINKKPKIGVGKDVAIVPENNVQGLPKGWDWLNRND